MGKVAYDFAKKKKKKWNAFCVIRPLHRQEVGQMKWTYDVEGRELDFR